VVFGAMMAHVSGGVFAPAAYRVVGDPFAGGGRCEVALELHPKPGASLDFVAALEEAGHVVGRRCCQRPVTGPCPHPDWLTCHSGPCKPTPPSSQRKFP